MKSLTFKNFISGKEAEKIKNQKKTDSGYPANEVEVNPNHPEKPITEAVVTLAARMVRAQNMRKFHSKLERTKKLAQNRMAARDKLAAKSRYLARRMVKRRVAGKHGWEYQSLGPSDKIAVDRLMTDKQSAVKTIAKRIAPKVKSAEVKRLNAFHSKGTKKGTLAFVNKAN